MVTLKSCDSGVVYLKPTFSFLLLFIYLDLNINKSCVIVFEDYHEQIL